MQAYLLLFLRGGEDMDSYAISCSPGERTQPQRRMSGVDVESSFPR